MYFVHNAKSLIANITLMILLLSLKRRLFGHQGLSLVSVAGGIIVVVVIKWFN